MTDSQQQPAPLGEQGEPCKECGAPLAADQRYCLNCGARRAGPRVDYRSYMGIDEAAATPDPQHQPETPAAPETQERDYAPLAAVGGIAVLGLMLLVGVLIGKGNSTAAPSAPAPIVKVGEPSGGSAASAETGKGETTSSKPKAGKQPKKVDTGAKAVEGGLTGSAASNSNGTVQATTDDLESLNGATGEDYEDAVKKLPDKIATPGAPPPIDKSKAPGGGGSAETFE